jgi:hypothetical protein
MSKQSGLLVLQVPHTTELWENSQASHKLLTPKRGCLFIQQKISGAYYMLSNEEKHQHPKWIPQQVEAKVAASS